MATLRQQVQQHLQNTGISLRELSRRSGVSHTTIGKILRGREYKSGTADSLLFAISFYAAGRLKTLDAAIEEINGKAAETLHDKVEQLAADRVDHDRGAWDTDLQCAKYRRVMQLEKELEQSKTEVGIVREQRNKLAFACEQLTADLEAEKRNFAALEQVHEQREQHLKSCENALIEANEKIQNVLDESGKQLADLSLQLYDAKAEIKRLTALSETQGQSWKAACVQAEQLQKQLDFSARAFNKTSIERHDAKAEIKKLDEQLTEVKAAKTQQEAQIMRLRVYVWSLIAALVFVLVSGLVVWGVR